MIFSISIFIENNRMKMRFIGNNVQKLIVNVLWSTRSPGKFSKLSGRGNLSDTLDCHDFNGSGDDVHDDSGKYFNLLAIGKFWQIMFIFSFKYYEVQVMVSLIAACLNPLCADLLSIHWM